MSNIACVPKRPCNDSNSLSPEWIHFYYFLWGKFPLGNRTKVAQHPGIVPFLFSVIESYEVLTFFFFLLITPAPRSPLLLDTPGRSSLPPAIPHTHTHSHAQCRPGSNYLQTLLWHTTFTTSPPDCAQMLSQPN